MRQAKALGDPTRRRLLELVEGAGQALSVPELVERLGLHHSAIRIHLRKLIEAGFVEPVPAEAGSAPRGRPPTRYRHVPLTAEVAPYRHLAEMLSEAVRGRLSAAQAGRSVGARLVAGPAGANDATAGIAAEAAARGFAPSVHTTGATTEIVLTSCPYAEVAEADPVTICSLHRGLLEGMADAYGSVQVDDLVPGDPHHAGCVVRLSSTPPPPRP